MKLGNRFRFSILGIVVLLLSTFSNVSSETEKNPKTSVQTSSRASIEALVREGKLAYRKKNYSEALGKWTEAQKIKPHDEEIKKLIIQVQEKLNSKPLQTQESSTSASSPLVPAHKKKAFIENQLRLGKQAYRKKDYKSAYNELKKGHEIDPKNPEIQRLINSILEKSPKIEEEIAKNAEESRLKIEKEKEKRAAAQAKFKSASADQEQEQGEEAFQSYQSFEPVPTQGAPLTLEQCIMIARANSLSVEIARQEAALARWKMAPARRALWPSVDAFWKGTNGTSTGQDFKGTEYAVEFQKPLLTWGKTKALFLQSKINWEIAKRNLQKEVSELDFKVEQAYFILSNALQDVQDVHKLYEDTQKDLEIAKKRYKLELVRELEWLKAKSKVDEIYYRTQAAEKDLMLAQLTLEQILDSRNASPFTVQARLGPYNAETTLEQCIDLALKNRSDLIVNEMLMEYNKLGQKIANSEYKWNVNLEGNVGLNNENFISESRSLQKEYFLGLKVTKVFGAQTFEDNFITQDKVPSAGQTTSTQFTSNTLKWYLWNSTAKINMKEADIKYLKSIDEYIKKRNSVVFEIKKSYYEYQKAKQQLGNNFQKVKIAEQEVKISVARLQLNEILDSELLETKDRFARTKAEYGQALSGYYTAVANLNKAIGLTDYFDLKRGVEETTEGIDPEAWKQFLNTAGNVGSLPSTAGYQDVLNRLENRKPWWQAWGGNSAASTQTPRTTQELIEKTTDEGVNFYRQGKYQEALSKFETALKLEPNNLKAESFLRKTKIKLGQEIEESGHKLNLTPKTSEADQYVEQGLKLYEQKQYNEAIQTWDKALKLDPRNRHVQVYIHRAKVKMGQGN